MNPVRLAQSFLYDVAIGAVDGEEMRDRALHLARELEGVRWPKRSLRRFWMAGGWMVCCGVVVAGVVLVVDRPSWSGALALTVGVVAGTAAVRQVEREYHRLEPPAAG